MAAQSTIRETISRPAYGSAWSRGAQAARFDFITAIPQDVYRGSGCFVGIQTLAKALCQLNCDVEMIAPRHHLPVLMLERIIFNESLRWRTFRPGSAPPHPTGTRAAKRMTATRKTVSRVTRVLSSISVDAEARPLAAQRVHPSRRSWSRSRRASGS